MKKTNADATDTRTPLQRCLVLPEISEPSFRHVGLELDAPTAGLVGPGPKRSEAPTCPERRAIRPESVRPTPSVGSYSFIDRRS